MILPSVVIVSSLVLTGHESTANKASLAFHCARPLMHPGMRHDELMMERRLRAAGNFSLLSDATLLFNIYD
jgi:hypothetical protein